MLRVPKGTREGGLLYNKVSDARDCSVQQGSGARVQDSISEKRCAGAGRTEATEPDSKVKGDTAVHIGELE